MWPVSSLTADPILHSSCWLCRSYSHLFPTSHRFAFRRLPFPHIFSQNTTCFSSLSPVCFTDSLSVVLPDPIMLIYNDIQINKWNPLGCKDEMCPERIFKWLEATGAAWGAFLKRQTDEKRRCVACLMNAGKPGVPSCVFFNSLDVWFTWTMLIMHFG